MFTTPPTFGADGQVVGYHSNRRTASRAALDAVEPLYRALLAEEARHRNAREAAEAGSALLSRTLEEQGTSYAEWVWALSTETAVAA